MLRCVCCWLNKYKSYLCKYPFWTKIQTPCPASLLFTATVFFLIVFAWPEAFSEVFSSSATPQSSAYSGELSQIAAHLGTGNPLYAGEIAAFEPRTAGLQSGVTAKKPPLLLWAITIPLRATTTLLRHSFLVGLIWGGDTFVFRQIRLGINDHKFCVN